MEVSELKLEQKGFDVAALVKKRMELLNVAQKMESVKAEIEKIKVASRARMDRSEKAILIAYRQSLYDLHKAKRNVIRQWNKERKLIRSLPRISPMS